MLNLKSVGVLVTTKVWLVGGHGERVQREVVCCRCRGKDVICFVSLGDCLKVKVGRTEIFYGWAVLFERTHASKYILIAK